jgi:hypothetical protein
MLSEHLPLIIPSNFKADVCIERHEGQFPIRTELVKKRCRHQRTSSWKQGTDKYGKAKCQC